MWPSLIRKAKKGGVDVIQTYVFWNLHEPQPGLVRKVNQNLEFFYNKKTKLKTMLCFLQYDFHGRLDLVGFLKEVQAQGLYACLRIGPFIEAEWNYGYAASSFFLYIFFLNSIDITYLIHGWRRVIGDSRSGYMMFPALCFEPITNPSRHVKIETFRDQFCAILNVIT